MRALVISGGGSKGAFAGGIAEYLINVEKAEYDLFIGSSTGSILISHLALGKIEKIKKAYTSTTQETIFSRLPFKLTKHKTYTEVNINYINVIKNLIKGASTFGESENLKKKIKEIFLIEEFEYLKQEDVDIVVVVSNLLSNTTEYKHLRDCTYEEFCDWIWISSNFIPFMSLVNKNGCDYADAGFGMVVPIEEAVRLGAKHIDVIVLDTKDQHINKLPSKNPFALMSNMFSYILDRVAKQNIRIGIYEANLNNVKLNFYYTPKVLSSNSLLFDKKKMKKWWEIGYDYARKKKLSKSSDVSF